jgi:hypothetical protein
MTTIDEDNYSLPSNTILKEARYVWRSGLPYALIYANDILATVANCLSSINIPQSNFATSQR